MFSTTGYYTQATPSTELYPAQSWDATSEGPQNFLDLAESAESEEYNNYYQVASRTPSQDFDIKTEATSVCGETMCRQGSAASLNNRALKATSPKSRPRVPAPLQTSQLSSYQVSDSSVAFGQMVSFPDSGSQMLYQPATLSLGMAEGPSLGLENPAQLNSSFDALFVHSPDTWGSVSSTGRSPRTHSPTADDVWTVPASSPESHASSPELQAQTRSSSECETARDHPLYKNAFPCQSDGLYHCPWEGDSGCTHKPEKLKCNYDKFVDSHLKPYRCKVESCESARFSSTACLLRHEREAHAMHGHGDKPYLCTYEGCDRAVTGNGFPRQWNLKDHMRRVHNDSGSASGTAPPASNPKPQSPSKSRKRKSEATSGSVRKSSAKATTGADGHGSRRSAAATKKPLIKEWYENYAALQESVSGMAQPDSMGTLSAIKDVQDRLGRLSTLSHTLVYSQGPRRFTHGTV